MAHRTFTDGQGREWQVWDVTPHGLARDRRAVSERRALPGRERDPERRRLRGRRLGDDRRTRRRLIVASGREGGWLAFETAAEKRRLLPVPRGWERLDDQALEALCARAARARPRRGRRRRKDGDGG